MQTLNLEMNNKMTLVTILSVFLAAITMKEWAAFFALLAGATTFVLNMVKLYPIVKTKIKAIFKKKKNKP